MVEKLLPAVLPPKLIYEEPDGQMIATPYRVVKLWEVDPAVAFEPGHAGLLELAPLLKGGEAELDEACRRIEYFADHPAEAPHPPLRMATNIILNASLRYDKGVLGNFLERIRSKMNVAPDIWEASWIYQDARAEGKRDIVRRALARKFPDEVFPDIEPLSSPEALDDLVFAVVEASSPGQAREAIAVALASGRE